MSIPDFSDSFYNSSPRSAYNSITDAMYDNKSWIMQEAAGSMTGGALR